MDKVNKLIKNELSLVLGQIRDKYLGFITITKVETARDLSIANVYFSSFENRNEDEVKKVLTHYNREIYNHMKARVTLKKMPHLNFKIDKAIIHANELEKLFNSIKSE